MASTIKVHAADYQPLISHSKKRGPLIYEYDTVYHRPGGQCKTLKLNHPKYAELESHSRLQYQIRVLAAQCPQRAQSVDKLKDIVGCREDDLAQSNWAISLQGYELSNERRAKLSLEKVRCDEIKQLKKKLAREHSEKTKAELKLAREQRAHENTRASLSRLNQRVYSPCGKYQNLFEAAKGWRATAKEYFEGGWNVEQQLGVEQQQHKSLQATIHLRDSNQEDARVKFEKELQHVKSKAEEQYQRANALEVKLISRRRIKRGQQAGRSHGTEKKPNLQGRKHQEDMKNLRDQLKQSREDRKAAGDRILRVHDDGRTAREQVTSLQNIIAGLRKDNQRLLTTLHSVNSETADTAKNAPEQLTPVSKSQAWSMLPSPPPEFRNSPEAGEDAEEWTQEELEELYYETRAYNFDRMRLKVLDADDADMINEKGTFTWNGDRSKAAYVVAVNGDPQDVIFFSETDMSPGSHLRPLPHEVRDALETKGLDHQIMLCCMLAKHRWLQIEAAEEFLTPHEFRRFRERQFIRPDGTIMSKQGAPHEKLAFTSNWQLVKDALVRMPKFQNACRYFAYDAECIHEGENGILVTTYWPPSFHNPEEQALCTLYDDDEDRKLNEGLFGALKGFGGDE